MLWKRFGYNTDDVRVFLDLLKDHTARAALLRSLRVDLAFPVFYGAALLLAAFVSRHAGAAAVWAIGLAACSVVLVASDLTENVALLHQIMRPPQLDIEPSAVFIASTIQL